MISVFWSDVCNAKHGCTHEELIGRHLAQLLCSATLKSRTRGPQNGFWVHRQSPPGQSYLTGPPQFLGKVDISLILGDNGNDWGCKAQCVQRSRDAEHWSTQRHTADRRFAKSANETHIKTKEATAAIVEDEHTNVACCPFVDHMVSDFRCQDDTTTTKNC